MSMIKARLREFKLSGIHNSYEERAKYALDKSLSYEEFLELLLEDEANNRADNGFKKRYSKAKFPYAKNIEDFDFAFQPSIDKKAISDICTTSFVKEKRNVVFIGSPGTGGLPPKY
jgi:DNA replication protein DnaC